MGTDAFTAYPEEMPEGEFDPVGVADIAKRVGVAQVTVRSWKSAGILPPDPRIVSGRPTWNWPDVQVALERARADGTVRELRQ